MKTLTTLIFLFFITLSFSQKMKISGVVYDTSGVHVLPETIVMAVRIKDSLLVNFTRTNGNGEFNLTNIPIDTYNIVVSHFRFEDKSYFIFGSEDNKDINIPKVKLNVKSKEIEEVVIYANKNPIYFRGDTMVYVADSFKVGQNAVVEDLLKKLPGIKVDKDGKIKSQGKDIGQVLVDGDEFFGSDPTVATKNLGAAGVETVEVYEKKNENATDGGDETIQVLNLKMKEDAKKGYFGRVSGAGDFNRFYEGELFANKFNKNQKISIFAISGNTPKSGVDWGDIDKFGLDNEASGSFNEDGDYVQTTYGNDGNGIPKTFKSGIYYSDKIGKKKKTKIGFNYTYMNYQLNSLSKSRSQYFLSDTSYFSDDSTRTITVNESHSVNFSVFSQIDSLNSIDFKSKFTNSLGTSDNKDYTTFLDELNIQTRLNLINNKSKSNGISVQNDLVFVHKFMKARRQLKLLYNQSYTDNNSNGGLDYTNNYLFQTSLNNNVDQSKLNSNSKLNHIGKITYTEPLTKKIKVEFDYLYENGISNQKKETRDYLNGVYSDLNLDYSNNFDNKRIENRFATQFIYESRKHIISIGSRFRNIKINNDNLFTVSTIKQDITNFLPKFSYTFKPTQTQRMLLKYNASSEVPAISYLQPIQDNTNPNRISTGNPSIKPTYKHTINGSYNSWNSLAGRYIWAGGNFDYINNDFVDSTTYNEFGQQTSKTVNVNGNYNGYIYIGSSIDVYKKIIGLNPNINISQAKNSNYINGQKNISLTNYYSGNLYLNFMFDSLNISIGADISYTIPKSSISTNALTPYSMQNYSASFNWTLPFSHISLRSDITYTINGQRANGYSLNYLIWNASINKAFLKTENLILSLQGNDMLNQNISAQRSVNFNIVTDYKTKIISRYFLVKLTYKFNNNKTKEEDGWN